MFVEDFMAADVRTITPDTRVARAQALMHDENIRHLPVCDEPARLVGIISDRDIRSAVGYESGGGAALTVAEIMSADPKTIPVDAALEQALGMFCETRVGALPVVRQRVLVGLLTRHDMLRAFYTVLGLDVPGKRIEVALPDLKTDLAAAFTALRDCDNDIISAVVSRMRRDGGEPALYLRVAGQDPRPVERHLRDAAVIVLQPEHP
ncbi:MAG: CBS domain-containing protein [Phycisphaerae bacterium]